MPSDLDGVEVDVGEHGVALNAELLEEHDQRLERVKSQELVFDPDKHRHGKIEDEVLVALK